MECILNQASIKRPCQFRKVNSAVSMPLSHFDEKSGVVPFKADWGQWYQTIEEVHIEITKYKNLKSKDVSIQITASHIKCQVLNNIVIEVKN